MVFLNALQSMASITLLCLIGYVVAWKGWVAGETEIFIPKFLTKVVLPPYLMGSVALHFKRDELLHLLVGSTIPLISILLSFALFLGIAWLFRVDKKHRYLFATAACTSNTIFIGIPVNTALFGDIAIPQVLLYFFGNTLFFWTIGNYCIASEGAHKEQRLSPKELLGRIFSPPLCGMLIGVALVLLEIPLPSVVTDTCGYLGNLTTPLALIFVGIILRRVNWRASHMGKDIALALIGRLIICPFILMGCLFVVPMQTLTEQVFIIQSGLPSMTNIALISAFYGADRNFGSIFVALSTVLAMLTVPAWMALIHMIPLPSM